MAGPAVLFCACTAPAVWARLSGATPRSARAAPGADKIHPVIAERLPLSARTNAGAFGRDGKARTRAICRRGMLADVARRPSTHTDALTMSAMNQGCDQSPKIRFRVAETRNEAIPRTATRRSG